MIFPVNDYETKWRIDQAFGNPTSYGFHEGVDLNLTSGGNTDLGQELKSIAAGKIVYFHYSSHPTTGFGRHITYRIDGAWGSRWVMYSHCDANGFLNAVQDVPEGKVIARLGNSGNSVTAHLHWSIFKVDPALNGGTDNIANTIQELNNIWEDPIAFVKQWMAAPVPQPSPITEQTPIPLGGIYGNPELQSVRSMLMAKDSELGSNRAEINSLKQKIDAAKIALG